MYKRQGFISRFSQTSGVGSLDFGFGDPYSWIQSRASNNYAINFDLALQPNGGNVGVGTSSPQGLIDLTVSQAKTSTGGSTFAQLGKTNESSGYASLQCEVKGGASAADRKWTFQTIEQGVANAGSIALQPDGGNVGIGCTPASKLDIDISTDARGSFSSGIGEVGSGNFALQVTNSAGSALKPLGFRAEDIRFATGSSERMRINSLGNLIVGMTDESFSTSDSGCLLRNTGDAYFPIQNSNTLHVFDAPNQAYRFYVNVAGIVSATNTSINGLSDERLKENIVDLETGLLEVMALQPRRFDWKNGDAQNVAGFIAQEVESVLPELVGDYKHEELEDCKSLKMGDMVPTLVKAIQEQQTLIESLTARIAALEE